MRKNPNGTVTVRVRATGQVIDMVPESAAAMLYGGTIEEVNPESTALDSRSAERAVTGAQEPRRRPLKKRS
jgi:hypothetical protein